MKKLFTYNYFFNIFPFSSLLHFVVWSVFECRC